MPQNKPHTMTRYFALLAVLAAGPALCAPKAAAKVKQEAIHSAAPVKQYSVSQLDYSTMQLPANYLGHSCRAVVKSLAALATTKGEFETTSAYTSRVSNLSSTNVVGDTKAGDYFAFVQDEPVASAKYDADSGFMHYTAYLLPKQIMAGSKPVDSVITEVTETSTSKYAASNAYGKGAEVTKKMLSACGLAFQNYSAVNGKFLKKVETTLAINPEAAKVAKDELAFMYVGVLAPPYLAEYRDHVEPTISSPIEAVWAGDLISMKLMQIWVFSKRTGQVYKKIDE